MGQGCVGQVLLLLDARLQRGEHAGLPEAALADDDARPCMLLHRAQHSATVSVRDGGTLVRNQGRYGGAVAAQNNCNITSVNGTMRCARFRGQAAASVLRRQRDLGCCSPHSLPHCCHAERRLNQALYGGALAVQVRACVCMHACMRSLLGGSSRVCMQLKAHAALLLLLPQDNAVIVVAGNSTLESNNASYGGAAAIQNSGVLTIEASTLSANAGTYGGAVSMQVRAVRPARCMRCPRCQHSHSSGCCHWRRLLHGCRHSTPPQNTGVLHVTGGSVLVSNSAQFGGAISAVEQARVSLSRCTLASNAAASIGGGVSLSNYASLNVSDGGGLTSVVNNSATFGGGIGASLFARVALTGPTLLASNRAASERTALAAGRAHVLACACACGACCLRAAGRSQLLHLAVPPACCNLCHPATHAQLTAVRSSCPTMRPCSWRPAAT